VFFFMVFVFLPNILTSLRKTRSCYISFNSITSFNSWFILFSKYNEAIDFRLGSLVWHRYAHFTFSFVRSFLRLYFGFVLGKLCRANWKWQFLLFFM
jgi:hypothetical protein